MAKKISACLNFLFTALGAAKDAILRFFVTTCFTLLVFLLSTPAEEVAATLADFDCTGVLMLSALVALIAFARKINTRKLRDRMPYKITLEDWSELTGCLLGTGVSSFVWWRNASTLAQIGTSIALDFIARFIVLYFVICGIRVVLTITLDLITAHLKEEESNDAD